MNKLVLLAATFVLWTGVMLAQSSPRAIDNQKPNATPDQAQRGPQATPPIVPHQSPETTANPARPEATPEGKLPNTTIDDQQPGNSTTGSASSTMGTTGSTPGTEPSAEPSREGNKSGTAPNPQTPDSKSTEPHDRYQSGSNSPNSPANGASSDDMSGTNPKPESSKPGSSTNSTNPQTRPPDIATHTATHTPDAGTEMNPAAVEQL